jgi:hypothetical protein
MANKACNFYSLNPISSIYRLGKTCSSRLKFEPITPKRASVFLVWFRNGEKMHVTDSQWEGRFGGNTSPSWRECRLDSWPPRITARGSNPKRAQPRVDRHPPPHTGGKER